MWPAGAGLERLPEHDPNVVVTAVVAIANNRVGTSSEGRLAVRDRWRSLPPSQGRALVPEAR